MGRANKASLPTTCGILVLDKPPGISSMAAVAAVRRKAGGVRTGHAGTLDPLASGVLVLALGKATKDLAGFMATDKKYRTVIDLTAFTTTDDQEGLRSEVADAFSQRDLSDVFDQGGPSVDSDTTTALTLVARAERRLWEVDEALARVADGTYGYCIDCGTGIPLERLRALPATERCVGCSRRTCKLVDRDHLRFNMQDRSLAGLAP